LYKSSVTLFNRLSFVGKLLLFGKLVLLLSKLSLFENILSTIFLLTLVPKPHPNPCTNVSNNPIFGVSVCFCIGGESGDRGGGGDCGGGGDRGGGGVGGRGVDRGDGCILLFFN
jgi:uncharacterized membrane protein YgcG